MPIYLITVMCALNHSGFGGSRVAISLYALELGATQFTVGILMALYALPPIFPGISTLYVVALLLGSTFPLFFVTVHGMTGDIGGPEHRARNYSLVSLGFSAAGFIGPFSAGLAIDHIGHLPAFVVLAAFTVVPALLLWLKPGFLPKPKKHAAAKGASALDLWRIPRLRNTFLDGEQRHAPRRPGCVRQPGHGVRLHAGIPLQHRAPHRRRRTDPPRAALGFCGAQAAAKSLLKTDSKKTRTGTRLRRQACSRT